jgi:hypothetical protein
MTKDEILAGVANGEISVKEAGRLLDELKPMTGDEILTGVANGEISAEEANRLLDKGCWQVRSPPPTPLAPHKTSNNHTGWIVAAVVAGVIGLFAYTASRPTSSAVPASHSSHNAAGSYEGLPEQQGITVYVTRTGSKYHRAGCRYLRKSSIPMSLSQASASYSPCSVCNPPTR